MNGKKMLFSGVQPSGTVTIGNYIGAIKNFKSLQGDYNCIYSIVDLHAITIRQNESLLRKNTLDLLALYLAAGLEPKESIIFVQSHVAAHSELCWILNTITYPGELSRMTQFKDKSQRQGEDTNMGLMVYPVLMAADILLYQTELVPVGADQKQHLELTRDLAIRFNNRYGECFKVPMPFIPKQGARIMSLTEPNKKMSKSDGNANAYISLDDDYDTVMRKFKRATTDSEGGIYFDAENKPGISNLLTIFSAATDTDIKTIERDFENKGYGEFKTAVGEAVAEMIKPIAEEKRRLLLEKDYLFKVMQSGAQRAEALAQRTMDKVCKRFGLIPKQRF